MTEATTQLPALDCQANLLRMKLQTPRTRFNHRELNRAQQELRTIQWRIERELRSRRLYDNLAPLQPPQQQQQQLRRAQALPSHVRACASVQQRQQCSTAAPAVLPQQSAARFLHDLTLPRPQHIDRNTLLFKDLCRCGTEMQRHPTLSFLVCPACSLKRVHIDLCSKDVKALADFSRSHRGARSRSRRHAAKTTAHYSHFLRVHCANKHCNVNPKRLEDLCFFCYVEGARHPDDIVQKVVNRAQHHTGLVEYPLTRTYVSLLRDDSLFIPEAVKAQMVKLFLYLHPAYSKFRKESNDESKTNMSKFAFLSRILCRLIGMDVLLPLFDSFKMRHIVVQRTAFMRQVFRRLGWEWCDAISDVTEDELDRYDAEHRSEIVELLSDEEEEESEE